MHNMPLPESIANKPELYLGLELYFKAFLDLTTTRAGQYQSEGVISWTAVNEWAKEYDVTGDSKEDLFYFIGRMDQVYLKHKAERLEKANEEAAKGR